MAWWKPTFILRMLDNYENWILKALFVNMILYPCKYSIMGQKRPQQ